MSACKGRGEERDELLALIVASGYSARDVERILGIDRRAVSDALARYRERVEQRETAELVEDIANDPAYRDDPHVTQWLMDRSNQRETGIPARTARKPGNDDLEKALARHLRSIQAMRPTGDDVARIERLVHQLSTIGQA